MHPLAIGFALAFIVFLAAALVASRRYGRHHPRLRIALIALGFMIGAGFAWARHLPTDTAGSSSATPAE